MSELNKSFNDRTSLSERPAHTIGILYSMFHVTWTTFEFNSNQLGTVSAFVMISVPWSNQRVHQVISEKLLSKEFHCRTTDHK